MEISVASLALVVVLWWIWRIVEWVWLKPKKLESFLRRQGLVGTRYTPLVGDMKRNFSMLMEARSKPMKPTDDLISLVMPYSLLMLNTYGKTFFRWLGPIPSITIMDPQLINEVYNKVYEFPKTHTFPLVELITDGLANADGDKWSKHRKIINPAFHFEKIKNMVPTFHKCCSEVVCEWEKLVSDKGSSCEIDVWPWLVKLSGDVISHTAFGSSYKKGQRIFVLQEEQAKLIIQAIGKNHIPGYRYFPTKNNRRIKTIDREIQVILEGVISNREKARDVGEAPSDHDLLDLLLKSNSGQTKGNGLTTKEIIEECKLFYFAGQETTSVLVTWTMVLLSQHQDWQARAREEVMQVFGDKDPDAEGINHLKIMKMIIYEVLRLNPPVIQMNRAIHKEIRLGHLTLPAGVQVNVPTLLIHRDTKLWGDDAAEFKPERFKDGVSKATKNQACFLPFGWGPRMCIGQKFSLLEAKMALALILRRFSFELSPSYVHAPYQVITIHPHFGAPLILHKL
ncbi:hypothetical protein EUTSA_v10021962mg [Eutrema salsugineum]|uniref:Cytochrome P450 n=1 Tax=Eutrema salsugineum TaxID=72664 RepID=V4M160_EUTSA|nr:cytochrome P450 72A13 [Eutrema salsugineum]ESQ48512.1 hypothetical protein EUTSA_v10021962mg [Eutrema salsugineum]